MEEEEEKSDTAPNESVTSGFDEEPPIYEYVLGEEEVDDEGEEELDEEYDVFDEMDEGEEETLEEEMSEEEVPFVSVFERLDAPRELPEPIQITEAILKKISVQLGQIRLCWPKKQKPIIDFMPNVILPDGYLMNTNKEKLLLLYCENFRQQYHQRFPNRKPLLLAADNVVGQRKMVCTTMRPTTLTSPNLSTWEELSSFVADHIKYEPIDPPTDLAGKRPLRSLTAHEKLEAIRRVHDGESKASVARDIGVPESTLRGWCKNEEKISYISRQSSPDTDDSIHGVYEPKEKKPKLDDVASPFNLSLKPSPRLSYSPGAEQKYPVDYNMKSEDKPLNLNTKSETPKSQMTEREKNRAELARLSIEFGLNRPEMYSSLGGALADLSSNIGLLSQWNNLFMQQKSSPKKVTAPADTSTNIITSSAPLLTTYNPAAVKPEKPAEKSPKLPKLDPPKSVEESVWYWLSLAQNQANLNMPSSTSSNGLSSATLPPANSQNNSWWKWYKQYTQVSQQLQQAQQQSQPPPLDQPLSLQTHPLQLSPQPLEPLTLTHDKQILYQQLTKDKDSNSENLNKIEEKPAKSTNNNKARAVLDNLLLNNNNVAVCKKDGAKDEEDLSPTEALEHGEKFLKWLECCSEPSVTAMQIMQFRGLINNIKSGADRKNGDVQQKTKVRRK